ncbi:aminopeptidase N [Frankliniella occidentalis]|uniref:Aminopeptidase N n=1 Tax=Frankliniella occidentalis TaxID=133901 RepID=A0A6J1TC66_FRAOC|nr:aminopeptidase N [Frankliniella occidentalis]
MSSPDGNSRSDFVAEPSAGSLTYGRTGGCFLTRVRGALLAAAVVAAIILAAFFGRYVWAPAQPQNPASLGTSLGEPTGSHRDGAGQRLPQDVQPVRYRLHLWPILDVPVPNRTAFSFEGRLALTVKVAAEAGADRVTLHAAPALTIPDDGVLVAEACPLAEALAESWDAFPDTSTPALHKVGVTVKRTPAWDLLELEVGDRLPAGGLYVVFIRFNGTLGDSLSGFYRSSYVDPETKAKKWLATTHMQPTFAREAFPCLDEPDFRAPFQVSIASSDAMHVLANAPLNTTEPISAAPGWRWHHFEQSVPMSTYLVAFAVTDFSYITPRTQRLRRAANDGGEIEVRLWARPAVLAKGRYAVELTPRILDFFGEYFSVRYPLRKLDLLAIPDFDAGAMENWGLLIFREPALLLDAEADVGAKEGVAVTVAHELAHQWLGNLVTAAWWNELWLNEGFSEYMQGAAVDHVEPSWQMMERFQVKILQPALQSDSIQTTRAIAARVDSEHDIMQAFDSIAYDKGACLLRMLHHSLGDAAFRRGVKQYMQTWKHNSTTESRLWEPLTEAVRSAPPPDSAHVTLPENTTVAEVMSAWTRAAGFPVVNVTRAGGKLVLTQEKFLRRPWARNSSRPYSEPQLWHVPVSMVTQSEAERDASLLQDTRPRAWLVARTLVLDMDKPDDWVLVNLQQTGFFRVNYDLDNWRLLSEQLRRDPSRLPVAVRAQLLDDAFALAGAGLLPYEVALNLTTYLPGREHHPRPWAPALAGLGDILSHLTDQPDYILFERYMQKLLSPLWEQVAPADPSTSATPSPVEANTTKEQLLHRAEMVSWSCSMHVDKCEDWAKRAVHKWRLEEDPDTTNPVPAMLRATAYCTAVSSGSSDLWDFMWQRYLAAGRKNVDQQDSILSALACTSDPARAAYLLERSISDGDIRPQDVGTVWSAAGGKPVAGLVVFRFLREHWPRIHQKFGADSLLSSAVVTAANRLSSSSDLDDLNAFSAQHNSSLGAVSRALHHSAEHLRTDIEWRQKFLPDCKRWTEDALRDPHKFAR